MSTAVATYSDKLNKTLHQKGLVGPVLNCRPWFLRNLILRSGTPSRLLRTTPGFRGCTLGTAALDSWSPGLLSDSELSFLPIWLGSNNIIILYSLLSLLFYRRFAYPAYCSIAALESKVINDDIQWLTYWVVFSAFHVVEYFAGEILKLQELDLTVYILLFRFCCM